LRQREDGTDADVGFVFTPLAVEMTGLPVAISVGGLCAVVIGEPETLDPATVAKLRRWVVEHARADGALAGRD
jgi:hypothetical protein